MMDTIQNWEDPKNSSHKPTTDAIRELFATSMLKDMFDKKCVSLEQSIGKEQTQNFKNACSLCSSFWSPQKRLEILNKLLLVTYEIVQWKPCIVFPTEVLPYPLSLHDMDADEFVMNFDVDPERGNHYREWGVDWSEWVPGHHYFDFRILDALPLALRKQYMPQQEDYRQLFRWLWWTQSPTGQIIEQLLNIGYPGVRSHERIWDKVYVTPKNVGNMYSIWCGDDGRDGTSSRIAVALYVSKKETSINNFSQDYGRLIRGYVKREEV